MYRDISNSPGHKGEVSNHESSSAEKIQAKVMMQPVYQKIIDRGDELLKSDEVKAGKCRGIYGAFSSVTGECIYIGKSKSAISSRWRAHARHWKKDRPIHRQQLLTQYIFFFKDRMEWKVLLPLDEDIDNDLMEFCERRLFEKYKPIANSFIPNGTILGRSIMEGEGEAISVNDWNSHMVTIRIHKGEFNGFSDGKNHF